MFKKLQPAEFDSLVVRTNHGGGWRKRRPQFRRNLKSTKRVDESELRNFLDASSILARSTIFVQERQMPFASDRSQKNYQRDWIRRRRQEFIDANGPCLWCGSDELLEVDHIDSNKKKFRVAILWSRSEKFRSKELKKCQVLCRCCHYLKTVSGFNCDHGSNLRYKWGCRCGKCRSAHAKVNSKYRQEKYETQEKSTQARETWILRT